MDRRKEMIFFDIDGTLIDHKKAEKNAVLCFYEFNELTGAISESEFYNLWSDIAKKYFNIYLQGGLTFSEQRLERIKNIFKRLGKDILHQKAEILSEKFLTDYEKGLELFEDAFLMLEDLKDYRLGIISNGDHKQQCFKLQKAGIIDRFEVVITAGSSGFAKPDKNIFRIACEKAKLEPEQCFYVGDEVETDIIACEKHGMKGILIDREKKASATNKFLSVTSLNIIKKLVNGSVGSI